MDLKTDGQIKAGDDIYTIITDERWSLLIPLSEKQAANLKERTSIRVKFLKDDLTQTGDFSIMEIDGAKYGKLDFNKGLIRYASDRCMEIELVTNNVTGLKIPLSSIVTKEFYAIPSKYLTTDAETQQSGFMLSGRNKKGNSTRTFVSAGIYGRDEITDKETQKTSYIYYVDKNKFKEGDALVDPDSGEKFIIGDTEVLEGVFCINQGYAVFRRIEILDENEAAFQTAELGKVDEGGGGTIAYILANYGMEVIDCGVAVQNMHAPFEVTSKADIYEAFKGYLAFLEEMGEREF